MKPGREPAIILLPLTAALLTYALAKGDYFLPPLVLLALLAGYRLPSPSWWPGRVPLWLAGVVLAAPALLYQRTMREDSLYLYIFYPWMVNAAAALGAVFLALLWYLPPSKDRARNLLLLSFAVVSLSGNYRNPLLFGPGTALYLLALLIYFKARQKQEQKKSPVPAAERPLIYWSAYASALVGCAVAGVALVAVIARSESMIMALGDEFNRLYEGGSSLRLSPTWQSGSVSGWEGSDEAIMEIEGEGPLPDHLRLQVFYRYDYENNRGTWFEGGKTTPTKASPEQSRSWVIGPQTAGPWKYKITAVAPFIKELPLPAGASNVAAEFALTWYPESGLIERRREGRAGETRIFEMEGGDAPLPDCGDTCRRAALAIPDRVRAALRPKALAITSGQAADRDKARAVVRHFQRYNYSLEPQHRLGPDPVIAFMAGDTATGLCRDFAEAAVLLLRSVDVPARAVGGFLVTDPVGNGSNTIYLKRRNLHAWIEVYCREDKHWEMADPTPADALEEALGRDNLVSHWFKGLWDRVRFELHRAANFVRDLTMSDVIAEITGKRIAVTFGTVIGVILAVYFWRRRGRFRVRRKVRGSGVKEAGAAAQAANPAGEVYGEFLALLAARGIAVAAHDTAADIIERVAAEPVLGLPLADCREFVALYRSLRFRTMPGPDLAAAVAGLSQLLMRLKSVDPGQNLVV